MRARLFTLIGAALLAAGGPARAESAAELYYDRAVMSAAGARCGLFDPNVSAALAAAGVQARNAALRADIAAPTLDAALARARTRANAAACAGPDVKIAAERVRQAFQAYAQLGAMTFPGDFAAWRALRGQSRINSAWRLWQQASLGRRDQAVLGLSGRDGQVWLTAVGAFADGAEPYAARLILRDPTRAPEPYIADLGGKAPLNARLPPASAERVVLAETREPAGRALLPPGAPSATAFRFPTWAIEALAGLDPREAVGVEFAFASSTGDRVERAYVEVGDFAAGLAFLRAGRR
jgi:hypothetical protein